VRELARSWEKLILHSRVGGEIKLSLIHVIRAIYGPNKKPSEYYWKQLM
jgi:hypothetical protein